MSTHTLTPCLRCLPTQEGFCYGKFEAFALTFTLPTLLLGHLTHLLPEAGERGVATLAAVLLTIFAAR